MPTVSARGMIDAPQEEVWAALADIENAGRWNKAWARVEFLGEQRHGLGTVFRTYSADGGSAEFEVVAWEPPDFLAFAPRSAPLRPPADRFLTVESQYFYLRPNDDGRTELNLVATASTHGLRGWLMGHLLWPGYQRQGLRRALAAIAALFEPEPEETEEGVS